MNQPSRSAMVELLVNIDVEDLAAAERFYRDAFGFGVGRRLGEGALELTGAGVPVYLLAQPAGSPAGAAEATRDYRRHWTPVHLDLAVVDLEAAIARAVAAGAALEQAPREAAWGRIAKLADPFGNGLCLIQFSAAGYDAIAAP